MKRVLMVAYHFPPYGGSSGIQRTLRFVQHLPALGWEPLVLTAAARSYERVSDDLLDELPRDLVVERAFALDTARHLSLAGRYPGVLARPDRWMTWQFRAIPAGMRLVRRFGPHVIWSTYPIATAHVIGRALRRRTGLPWIADFRDPMAQDGYPPDPRAWKSFKTIEEDALGQAAYSIFATQGAARCYRARYPDAAHKVIVVENGYDEESFAALGEVTQARQPLTPGAVTLLHSGLVYPMERDPTHFFAALGRLSQAGRIQPARLRVRFRAPGHEDMLKAIAEEQRVGAFIEILPPAPYRAALEEMMRADALIVLQAANCNEQIPAKLYEYLRAGRPVIALTDPQGDTAGVMRGAGLDSIARLDSTAEIADLLLRFVDHAALERAPNPCTRYVAAASRASRTEELARLLEQSALDFGGR
jgi:glycosyltransferase involved in cell wall biosynthesis